MASSWLWPDRTIGKRESRQLREEHNRVVNENAELLTALKDLTTSIHEHVKMDVRKHYYLMVADAAAGKAIAKAAERTESQ